MALDLPTLLVIAVFASAIAGLLLLLSWLQDRSVRPLAFWAAAFIIGAVGTGLIAARGEVPDAWSIAIANAVIAVAYGLLWGGARNFEGRPASAPLMLTGAVIWLLACQVAPIYGAPAARAAVMSAIIIVYSVLSAWEFWRGRNEGLMSRWPIIVFLLVHAAIVLIRIPLAGSLFLPTTSQELHLSWWTFVIFEVVFFSFCITYLLGGLARERVVRWYKQASLVDPLTGVGNRRAFLERGQKLLQRTVFDRRPAVLLMFDLDKFKQINDSYGHHVGDQVLVAFCSVATAMLRPDDLFARLGGEEFACLLPHSSLDDGLKVAERIRARLAATPIKVGASTLAATVSVGVALPVDHDHDLAAVIVTADRALYRAKTNGRNRVEYARAEPVVRIDGAKAVSA